MQDKLWPTMKANWVVWPLANFVAFRFLHQDVRILYANVVGVRSLSTTSLASSKKRCCLQRLASAKILRPGEW